MKPGVSVETWWAADNRLKNLPRKETVDEEKKKIRERFNVIPTALGKPTMGIDGHVPEK